MLPFNVSYEIITPESAEIGEAAETGFIAQALNLREAIDALFSTRTSAYSGLEAVECDEWPIIAPRWITAVYGLETRSLHMPQSATPASRRRIARLCGVSAKEFGVDIERKIAGMEG